MADKFPSTVNAFINFVAGEQPTADKFNALVAQTKYGFSGLETAVGDIHSASWPYIADETSTSSTRLTMPFYRNTKTGDEVAGADAEGRSLDIVSLARLIGPSSNLNPIVLDDNHQVVEEVISGATLTEFQLRYPVSGTISATNPSFVNDSANAVQFFKSSTADVASDGDYHVNQDGTVFCFKPIATNLRATYTTDPMTYGGGPNHPYARFNVIPDPNQVNSSSAEKVGVSFAGADGLHTVQLPLVTHQQTNRLGNSSALDDSQDLNYQVQAKLPFVLTENMTIGQTIPSGFLYLKNVTTNEVYTEATYIYNDEDTFQVGNVDLEDRINAGDTFQVITVGTDITSAILDLQYKLFNHKHGRAFGEQLVSVRELADNYRLAGQSGTFMPSTMDGNYFAQYLHRDGYRPNDESTICNDANAMRGNLVFGKVSGDPGEYVVGDNGVTTRGSTYGICFGGNTGDSYVDSTFGPTISGNSISSAITHLHLKTEDNSGATIQNWGQGSFLVNMDNYLQIESDSYARLRSNFGDLYLTAGDDVQIESSDSVYITSGNDYVINIADNVNATIGGDLTYTFTDSDSHATFVFEGWNGGNTSTREGFHILGDDNLSYRNSLFVVRGKDGDGSLVYFDNTITTGVNYNSTLLRMRYSEINKQQLGGSSSSPGAVWIDFTTDGNDAGKIQSRHVDYSPKQILLKIDNSNIVRNAGSHNRESSGDVAYMSGGGDFGELVICGDTSEWPEYELCENNKCMYIQEGLIVYVREGKFYRNGEGVPMVVTHRAMMIGNSSNEIEGEYHTVLSFVGQVPVIVKGSYKNGDYLVPTSENYCVALDPNDIDFNLYKKVVGTAWETALGTVSPDRFNRVLCAVGVK